MVNIGIDFGSTYTMVSVFRDERLKTVQPDGLTYSYPSMVAYDTNNGKYYYGAAARAKLGSQNTIVYRGFKMLLNQQMTPDNLAKRGYDGENTPEYITGLFLRFVIENSLKKLGENKVGTLVLGAPECWFQSLNTVDARGTLRELCSKMTDIVDTVKIVSEPTNAAAFCVWNFEQDQEEDFKGRILVVDYGGGTLDTALVNVNHVNGGMQIKPELRAGAGENQNHEIGKAGIAYQEAVVRTAVSESLGIDPDEVVYDKRFNLLLKSFEEGLLTRSAEIEEIMSEYLLSPEGLEDEIFDTFEYGGEDVEINYYQLYTCYMDVINPVLEDVLMQTTEDLPDQEDMHIALVGGFCNFYLVKKQIYDYFNIGTMDDRIRGMLREEADRERAIAHGAALFAQRALSVCNVAQFSIGTYAIYSDGTLFNQYAINYGQEIENDRIYFAQGEDGKPCPMFAMNIDKFLLNFGRRDSKGLTLRPKLTFAEKLRAVEHGPCITIGFSLDAMDRLTVHVYNYDLDKLQADPTPVASIPLATLKDMFENTVLVSKGDA